MPAKAADEIARGPAQTAAWTLRRHLPAGRSSDGAENRLPHLLEIVCLVFLEFPTERTQIACIAFEHVPHNSFYLSTAAARSSAKRLSLRCLYTLNKGPPACI